MIDLNTLWFIVICVLFTGFFFLEGFDFGVGIVAFFIGKTDTEKRYLVNAIGPVWNSNEVWLITAGGAMFAAFPEWYATLFSGLYIALFLLLISLIIRGVSIEFRSRLGNPKWQKLCDIGLFVGSALSSILIPVALAYLLIGLPIDSNSEFRGSFFTLLSLPALIAGLMGITFVMYHACIYLQLRVSGELAERAAKLAVPLLAIFTILGMCFYLLVAHKLNPSVNLVAFIFIGIGGLGAILAIFAVRIKKYGVAFASNALLLVGVSGALFCGLYPNVMISSLNPAWNLTIYSASSSPYTLKIMTFIALSLLPIVLGYVAWSYWIFRKKITQQDLEY